MVFFAKSQDKDLDLGKKDDLLNTFYMH